MRIALVVYGSLEQISGGYLYDRQVVEHLRRQGVEVDVHSLPAAPYLLCVLHNFSPRLRRLLRRGRDGPALYDAVVLDELVHPSVFLAAGGPAGGRRAPLFTLVHHLKSRESLGALHRAAARCMERRLLQGSDRLLVNSRTTEATVRELLVEVPPLRVCPPGCDLLDPARSGPPRPAPVRRPLPGESLTLLTTGNLIPRKGHDLLLRALAGLQDLPWRLRVAGRAVDRRYAAGLRRFAERRGLGRRVCFTGELGGAALAAEYAGADIFVFPSRYEGYGISLAEALRSGLPFVAFASGAVPEVVGSASAPGLVPENDLEAFGRTLARMLSDRAYREAAAARSRELGGRLPTWAQTGECFLRALREALSRA